MKRVLPALSIVLLLSALLTGCGALLGFGPDTTAPTVSFRAPVNVATDVAINTRITAVFDESMNPATITTTTFTVKHGSTSVSGTVTYAVVGLVATFRPAANLLPGTAYTATITSGAQDLAGNALAADFIWTFTTGADADTTPPTVSAEVPAVSATNVAIDTKVTAIFSEEMLPTTITTSTFSLRRGTTPVSGLVDYAGVTATFSPGEDLASSTLYTATISGVTDLAGNALASDFVWTFTTRASPDTTAPTVSSTVPADAAAAVAMNTHLSATFSEAMDPATITTATFTVVTDPGATPVSGGVTYVGSTASFVPAADLVASTAYTATITSGARDLAGNALASDSVWTFTTGASLDTTAPTVISTVPAAAATGVAVSTSVTATFSEAMLATTVTTASFAVTGPGTTPVAGAVDYSSSVATFTPGSSLAAFTLYTATMTTEATDLAGNAMVSDKVWTFTTAVAPDTTPPTVISTVPVDGATGVAVGTSVTATFSEAMLAATITTAEFTLTGPGTTPVGGTVDYSSSEATFTPGSSLAASTLYTATITTEVTDVAGNAMVSDKVWTFTTAVAPDTSPPTVISTAPADSATSVAVGTSVTATFSEAMQPATVTAAEFTLTGPGTTPVGGTVDCSGSGATFTPGSILARNTLYTATITTGVKDMAGNAMSSNRVWTFTTAMGPAPVALGTAGNYVMLAKTGIHDVSAPTVTSTVTGDLGVSPITSTAITGFVLALDGSGQFSTAPGVTGRAYAADYSSPTPSVLETAVGDMLSAYADARDRAPPDFTGLYGGAIGGRTLGPGLYAWGSAVGIATDLTLTGGPNDVWIFQVTGALTTAGSTSVLLSGGALAKNVFWQVAGAPGVTVGAAGHFEGVILAITTINPNSGAVVHGRLLAQTAINVDGATVSQPAP